MKLILSRLAITSLREILNFYEEQSGIELANSIENQILNQIDGIEGFEMSVPRSNIYPNARKLAISKLPYVAFIREIAHEAGWEVIDIIHTSMKLPK